MEFNNENKDNLIKFNKLKIHVKYIIGISIGITALVIVESGYQSDYFVDQVSFAGMISSIILSVIAIIMTIIGEAKTDNTKNKLEEVSENLIKVSEDINKSISNLSNVSDINLRIDSLATILNETYSKVSRTAEKIDINWNTPVDEEIISEIGMDYIKVFDVLSRRSKICKGKKKKAADIFIWTMYFVTENMKQKIKFNFFDFINVCDLVLDENIKSEIVFNYSYYWGISQCFSGYKKSKQSEVLEQNVKKHMTKNFYEKKLAIDKFIENQKILNK